MASSKRTWSLPLPVHPWAIYFAPNLCAASTRCFEIRGRESADTSGYLFSYIAFAASAFVRYSCANIWRISTTMHSSAPTRKAFSLTFSRPSCSCPTSPTTAMTSRFISSCNHFMQQDVSRPPEYASTTLSFCSAMMIGPFECDLFSNKEIWVHEFHKIQVCPVLPGYRLVSQVKFPETTVIS